MTLGKSDFEGVLPELKNMRVRAAKVVRVRNRPLIVL